MRVKDLISILKNYNDSAEIEIEVYDAVSDESIDTTFDIGIREEPDHPVLTITTDRSPA